MLLIYFNLKLENKKEKKIQPFFNINRRKKKKYFFTCKVNNNFNLNEQEKNNDVIHQLEIF